MYMYVIILILLLSIFVFTSGDYIIKILLRAINEIKINESKQKSECKIY